jgi:hypothetical protein
MERIKKFVPESFSKGPIGQREELYSGCLLVKRVTPDQLHDIRMELGLYDNPEALKAANVKEQVLWNKKVYAKAKEYIISAEGVKRLPDGQMLSFEDLEYEEEISQELYIEICQAFLRGWAPGN